LFPISHLPFLLLLTRMHASLAPSITTLSIYYLCSGCETPFLFRLDPKWAIGGQVFDAVLSAGYWIDTEGGGAASPAAGGDPYSPQMPKAQGAQSLPASPTLASSPKIEAQNSARWVARGGGKEILFVIFFFS
jgi:hypothetical protein